MSETGDVLKALCDAWAEVVAPKTQVPACILAAAVSREALKYFGLGPKTDVVPVAATATNEDGYEYVRAEVPAVAWPDEAWAVYAGSQSKDLDPGRGWSGHMAVLVDGYYVDLTAAQFDRPAKEIETGGALLIHRSQFELVEFGGGSYWHVPLVKGHYLWHPEPKNDRYRGTPDWTRNRRHFAGDVIRYMREVL